MKKRQQFLSVLAFASLSWCSLGWAETPCKPSEVWNACAKGSCPTCDDCVGACVPSERAPKPASKHRAKRRVGKSAKPR